MANLTYEQVLQQQAKPVSENDLTTYTVDGIPYKVPRWSHPGSVANRILEEIRHTYYYGVQVIAPPGNGKTTIAKVLTHHLHTKALKKYGIDFTVRLEVERKTHAFRNLDNYIRTLPKKPTIVIFDDLSGVFGQMSEEEIDKNFETLTQVRWVLDQAYGHIPFIPILTYHYSKIIEKKFRSQNGVSIFCRFGNEERTNLDSIAPKKSQARKAVRFFQNILKTMFIGHTFSLPLKNGQEIPFDTDNPFRACLYVSDDVGNVIISSHKDICDKCNVESVKKRADELEAVKKLKTSKYGHYAIQQLRQALANRGVKGAIHPDAEKALEFIENRWLPAYDYDLEKLKDAIYKTYKLGAPKKANRKRKEEDRLMKELDKIAYDPETDKSKDLTNS